jgi:hypothetical protein
VTTGEAVSLIRRGMLALLAFGCVGLIGELVILEHYEELNQYPPLALLSLTTLTIIWHWTAGGRASLRTLQVISLFLIISGAVGVYFHLTGNIEATKEFEPDLAGLPFWVDVIRGAAPSLAPGTMVQFGLLGLLYAYRHPALSPKGS